MRHEGARAGGKQPWVKPPLTLALHREEKNQKDIARAERIRDRRSPRMMIRETQGRFWSKRALSPILVQTTVIQEEGGSNRCSVHSCTSPFLRSLLIQRLQNRKSTVLRTT